MLGIKPTPTILRSKQSTHQTAVTRLFGLEGNAMDSKRYVVSSILGDYERVPATHTKFHLQAVKQRTN